MLTGHTDEDFEKPNWVIRTKISANEKLEQIRFINFGDQQDDPETPKAPVKQEPEEVKTRTLEIYNEEVNETLKSDQVPKETQKDSDSRSKENSISITQQPVIPDSVNNSKVVAEETKEPNVDELYESMSSISGIGGEVFHSFVPSAQLHEEDRKTVEKVRDAGYKIPKYNILEDYTKLRIFNDDEADEFDENAKIVKYSQIFMRKSQYTKAQAAAIFQCRYRMKLNREMKRRKQLMKSSIIGFFIRKFFCKFKAKSSIQDDNNNHFYVKFSINVSSCWF